jgi:asparagine synthase (glutamine-hydrolysing)
MCGISCVVCEDPRERPDELIVTMNDRVRHRGPDASGVHLWNNIALGHTRLSIIDLLPRSSQPMHADGHHITFNGEIYNYRELRRELEAAGHIFATTSDTEALLVALRHWGMDALDRLNGMFAFVYLDERRRKLFLVRDRFGKKPLVYSRRGGRFTAASEAKQILALWKEQPSVDMDSARRFLVHGALNLDSRTFFAGIEEIPGGHYGEYDLDTNEFRIVQWYDLPSRVTRSSDCYEAATERVRDLLISSVQLRHIADVPVGACLSGGVDSSAIVALSAAHAGGHKLLTITSYAEGVGYDERRFSREVAAQSNVESLEICPDIGDIWDPAVLQEIAFYQDQPISSGSHYNEYCVFRAAREAGLTVMLDGQGADEYFGGYGEFWYAAQMENLKNGRLSAFREGIKTRSETTGLTPSQTLRRFLYVLLDRNTPPIGAGAGRFQWLGPPVAPPPARQGDFAALSLTELLHTSIPYQLHSEDRNSMRWSVESRLPFLDYRLAEYVIGLPTSYKVGAGFLKRILRDAVPELPPSVAGRKDKIGFAAPDQRSLLQNAARVRGALHDALSPLNGLVAGGSVMAAFDAMVREGSWYDPVFFRIIAFDAWRRAFNAGAPF